jgi:prenyltransferase beta subunit
LDKLVKLWYIPFLRFLYEKRDDIYELISGTKEDGTIPRYAVPGLVRTKAIYMSDMIAKLTGEFSKEKNITQREVVEGALIEYLQKYRFKGEIETLLKN